MKPFLIIITFALIVDASSLAQQVDTSQIVANANLKFLSQESNLIFNRQTLCELSKCQNNARFLTSNGIEKMLFFEIVFDSVGSNESNCLANYAYQFKGKAVFAFDIPSENLFLINNENKNEWGRFLSYLQNRINGFDLMSKKEFMRNVFVENAKMNILFRELKSNSPNHRNFAFQKTYTRISSISWRK